VGGEAGSADTARDPRGFAVKFYTEEGNWDMVGCILSTKTLLKHEATFLKMKNHLSSELLYSFTIIVILDATRRLVIVY
jgi:hypothetical protein